MDPLLGQWGGRAGGLCLLTRHPRQKVPDGAAGKAKAPARRSITLDRVLQLTGQETPARRLVTANPA